MKLAIIYDPECPKLKPESYSQSYRDMFLALCERFTTYHVTGEMDPDLEADVIIVYDIHSSHHVDLNLKNHPAVKYTYFNDPWQEDFKGRYRDGQKVHKLGYRERALRAMERGIDYIICPYEALYYQYIHPHLDKDRLVWFPVCPDAKRYKSTLLKDRKAEVLLNGHVWPGRPGFKPYEMRRWAYKQPEPTKVEHVVFDSNSPAGSQYPEFLSQYAGALALSDTHVVPKYLEIPLAGCVCFAQYHYEYERMGFKDGESCVYVNRGNMNDRIKGFKAHPYDYQPIADAGRKIIEDNYTAERFADYIYKHARERVGK